MYIFTLFLHFVLFKVKTFGLCYFMSADILFVCYLSFKVAFAHLWTRVSSHNHKWKFFYPMCFCTSADDPLEKRIALLGLHGLPLLALLASELYSYETKRDDDF